LLNPPSTWVPIEQATISYGYGISVTLMQLARAYAVLANGGELPPINLLRQENPPERTRVMTPGIAHKIRRMLELAVGTDGTGAGAQVPDYRVAGKTGTVHKLTPSGYSADEYVAWFAGFAPMDHPRLVMVVMIDRPRGDRYYGGQVAAPVFSQVMSGALRLLDVPPDAPRPAATVVAAKEARGTR
jgi:cell division protein FtsI (penicillin-binding protein 3)